MTSPTASTGAQKTSTAGSSTAAKKATAKKTSSKTSSIAKKWAEGKGTATTTAETTTNVPGDAGASEEEPATESNAEDVSLESPPDAESGAVVADRGDVSKKAYEEELSKMRQAAWMFEVELERKKEARRRKAAETEREIKAAESKLRKDMLEAAFDGEVDELRALVVERGGDPECSDSHGNSCLSEAAAGGDVRTVQYLLNESGVDPNSRGEFGRTPLWRACFLGKADVIPILLAAGADPRITDVTGETCGGVSSSQVWFIHVVPPVSFLHSPRRDPSPQSFRFASLSRTESPAVRRVRRSAP